LTGEEPAGVRLRDCPGWAEATAAPVAAPPVDDRQLDLFAWKPRAHPLPPPGTQLDLFDR